MQHGSGLLGCRFPHACRRIVTGRRIKPSGFRLDVKQKIRLSDIHCPSSGDRRILPSTWETWEYREHGMCRQTQDVVVTVLSASN
jgi:hypothetical protein